MLVNDPIKKRKVLQQTTQRYVPCEARQLTIKSGTPVHAILITVETNGFVQH